MTLYKFAINFMRPLSFLFLRLTHKGRENQPKSGSYIICCNHLSLMDAVLLGIMIKRPIRYMAKKELFRHKVLAFLFKKAGAFPVDRDKADITAIKTSLKILKNGDILGIFPEGTRVKSQADGEANMGVGLLATKANVPILPVHIISKNNKVRLFRKVTIVIGEPMTFDPKPHATNEDFKEISSIVMKKVYSLK
ncbi:MAG: lysophospholipid acyltransferase family protein [Clostridia bacterium]